MISDAGTFTYGYDDLNRLTGVTNHKDEVFGFNYDVNNRLLEINRPGSKTRFDFDVTSFINNITHTKINTSVINFFDYSRDAIGNRTEVRSPASITNYDYDDNNQLIASDSSATVNESFAYDPLGNRITDVSGNYVYDDKFQRIKEDYQFLYTFDDDGNLSAKISKDDQQNYDIYVHNSENKLISIRTFAANVLSKEVNYTGPPHQKWTVFLA